MTSPAKVCRAGDNDGNGEDRAMGNVALNEWTGRPDAIGDDRRVIKISTAHGIGGIVWFGGWMFTIGFAKLVWWKILLGVVSWPLFLGLAVR
jgi:hypothetical protein